MKVDHRWLHERHLRLVTMDMLGGRMVASKTLQYDSSGEPAGSGELSRLIARQPACVRALRVTSAQNEDRSSAMSSSDDPTDLRVDVDGQR